MISDASVPKGPWKGRAIRGGFPSLSFHWNKHTGRSTWKFPLLGQTSRHLGTLLGLSRRSSSDNLRWAFKFWQVGKWFSSAAATSVGQTNWSESFRKQAAKYSRSKEVFSTAAVALSALGLLSASHCSHQESLVSCSMAQGKGGCCFQVCPPLLVPSDLAT